MTYNECKRLINQPYTYQEYIEIISNLVDKQECSGPDLSEEKIKFTSLNYYRMQRVEKQFKLDELLAKRLNNLSGKLTWIILSESWCGDAAQTLPAIAKIASNSPNISLHVLFRDAHPELMDHYLTNGTRSIPKLICFNGDTGEELGTWGSRPEKIKRLAVSFKEQFPQANHEEFLKNLHLWYAKDRSKSIQADLSFLLDEWIGYCQLRQLNVNQSEEMAL